MSGGQLSMVLLTSTRVLASRTKTEMSLNFLLLASAMAAEAIASAASSVSRGLPAETRGGDCSISTSEAEQQDSSDRLLRPPAPRGYDLVSDLDSRSNHRLC